MKPVVVLSVGILLAFIQVQSYGETTLGLSGEFPSAQNYLVRTLMDRLELYVQTGLDVQNYEELKQTRFSLGFGADYAFFSREKLDIYAGGKALFTLLHKSIGNRGHTKTYFSIIPIIGLRYEITKHFSISYELQWEFTFGSFSGGTKGNTYLTLWL